MDIATALQILPRVISPVGIVLGVLMTLGLAYWFNRMMNHPRHAAVLAGAWSFAVAANLSSPSATAGVLPGQVFSPRLPILEISTPSLGEILSVSDASINLLLFAPAGLLSAVVLTNVGARQVAVLLLVIIPLLLETVQACIPALGRVATTSDAAYEAVGGVALYLIASCVMVVKRRATVSRTAGSPGMTSDTDEATRLW